MTDATLADLPIGRHQPFRLFWLARVSATMALQMQVVAIGWQIYAMTESPLDLGLVGLAQFVPAFLLVLVAGHVADRYDRTVILRLCQIFEGAGAALLALGTATGWLSREWIFFIAVLIGTARAFEMPSLQALLPLIVPARLLPKAVAGSASANQTATIAGPAIGGLLFALSPTLVYAACAVLFLAASFMIALLSAQDAYRPAKLSAKREKISFEVLFAGIAFIRNKPAILGAISLDLFAVLLGGATALLPIYAKDILQTGPLGLGLLRAAPAIGALLMAMALARWSLSRNAGHKMFASVAIFGVATIVFALSTSFSLSLAALVVLGAADMVSVVVRQTLVQMRTPDNMRGRVTAVNALFIGTSNQLGEFRAGVMAQFTGALFSVLIGGLGTLAVVALWMKLFPSLLKVDDLGRVETDDAMPAESGEAIEHQRRRQRA